MEDHPCLPDALPLDVTADHIAKVGKRVHGGIRFRRRRRRTWFSRDR